MSDPVRNYDHKTIQFRRGTTAEWQKFGSTCIPAEAEICVEFFQNPTGSRNGSVGIKIGNGVSTFNQLPHIVSDEESDPVFTNHPAYQITQDLIDSWNDDAEGIPDAPNSKAYSRQKGVWVEAPTLNQVKDLEAKVDAIDPDGDSAVGWDEIENKPTEFPPAAHNHDGDYLKDETDPTVPAHVKGITQDDIDSWNAGGSGGASTWDELTGKPTEFPPEAHTHEIDDVTGLQDALDAAGGTPAWDDVTGKPTEFPPEAHTHEQSEVDGLELRLEAIEDSITTGGGFVDAPDDGKLYGRQSEAWAEVVIPDAADPDWADIQNKPAEFPPEDHTHDYLSDAPDDGNQYVRQSKAWAEITIPDIDSPDYTLPVALRSGNAQLPLTQDGAKLAVMTRGGELELPLAA